LDGRIAGIGVKYCQAVEKGSECFESLSMNGKSSMISKLPRSS